jgi:hypothetical protein
MLRRGNHKSAMERPLETQALFTKDVKHGFSMPCLASVARDIPGAMVQPCGMAQQFALQTDGSREIKNRLTHDLSFSSGDPTLAVNQRIDMDQYPEMIYRWCLLRVLHFVVVLRLAHPDRKIFISKYDFSYAYK